MAKIGLYGIAGHMGVTLAKAIIESDACELPVVAKEPIHQRSGRILGC